MEASAPAAAAGSGWSRWLRCRTATTRSTGRRRPWWTCASRRPWCSCRRRRSITPRPAGRSSTPPGRGHRDQQERL